MEGPELAQLIEVFNEDHAKVEARLEDLRQALDQLSWSEGTHFKTARLTMARVALFMETEVELHLQREEQTLFANPVLAQAELMDAMLTEHREIRGRIARFRLMASRLDSADQLEAQRIHGLLRSAALDLANFLQDHTRIETATIFPRLKEGLEAKTAEATTEEWLEAS